MSLGSAWASSRDRAFVLAEEPQRRRHVEWTDQGTRRRAEWEGRRARLLAEVAADISATMEQLKADVSAAIADALRATLSVHHEKPDLAPTTTTTSVVSEMSTSIQMPAEANSVSTSAGAPSDLHDVDLDLALAVSVTCSTEYPGTHSSSSGAATATSPSVTRVVSSPCVLHDRGDHLAVSCFQPRGMPACVLPSIATPETSLVPLSMALEEYTVAPVNPSSNIVADPQVLTSATTKQAASAALESDSITALSANICEVCLEDVPDVPAAVLMQATLIIADSGGSDALVSLPALVDKPDGTDTAVTHENEQQLTSLSLERSLIFIAAKDVTNEDNLATSTFVMPAIASRATNPNKLIHGDRNLGMYLHPKFRFPMWVHAPWDPGEHAKEMQSPILRDSLLLASCWRFAPNQIQFIGGRLCLHINLGDSKSMSWEDMVIIFQCVTSHEFSALVEHLHALGELSCSSEPWTSWEIQLFIPGTRIAPPLYALQICLKVRTVCIKPDELVMRLALLMQTYIFALHCCSTVLCIRYTRSSLRSIEYPWSAGSAIQPGTSLFLGTASFWFRLSKGYTVIHHGLLLYMWSLAGMTYLSAILIHYQWYIAWSFTLACSTVSTIHLSKPDITSMTTEVLASKCGLHFLIGGTPVHYSAIFQREIAWPFDLEDVFSSFGGNPRGLRDASYNHPAVPSQVPWDPGGLSQVRLGGKPKIMEGGLSAILPSTLCLGWKLGRQSWASAFSVDTSGFCYKYSRRWPRRRWLGQNGWLRPESDSASSSSSVSLFSILLPNP